MLKRSIKYKDFNGNEVSEDFYFNLTLTELVEMEFSATEGLEDMIRRIIETENKPALIAEFKKMILAAYGIKSDDGKRFVKTDELREDFKQTAAYDALFMELVTDANAAATFVGAIIPSDAIEALDKQNTTASPAPQVLPPPPPQTHQL